MTNETAPERIGLITNGFDQWALATIDEADISVHYVRADALEAAQARIAELEGECSRRAALIPIAYGEGVVDAFARGATVENSSEKFEGSDVRAALVDPEIHRSEWPDNYDNAMARAALEGKGCS